MNIQANKITLRPINELIEAEYNPRELTDNQATQLADSLKRFGFVDPVLVNINKDRKDIIIGGHQRTRIAKQLGYTEVPCVELDLTLEQERELNVRLNKNTGQFDMDALANYFDTEELIEWGFSNEELSFFEDVVELEAEEDDFEVPDEVQTDIVQGDLIEIGEHRLLCGDSTSVDDVERLMDGNKCDMVFTDPPYNVAFNGRSGKHDVIMNDDLDDNSFKDLIDGTIASIQLLNPDTYYIWCNWKFYGVLQGSLDYKSCIVWAKNVFGLGRGYRHQHEFCLYNGKIDEGINNESDLWEVKKDTNYMHPTQKPVELSARALGNHKNAMNIVDLFGGSGSTLAGVHQLGRKGFIMELDPKYCQVIVDRMMNLDPKLDVKINGKKYERKQ